MLRVGDRTAIENGVRATEDFASKVLEKLSVIENLIQQHTSKCFSWLLREGRIEINVVLIKDAIFHPKVWLFKDHEGVIAAHGSSNVTYAGINKNIEQIAISLSRKNPNQQRYITDKFRYQFDRL